MAAAAADYRGLDIAEPQIAVYYPDDPNVNWHTRILLEKLNDQGRWVAATPDGDIQVLDLAQYRVLPIPRGAPAPPRLRHNHYHFGDVTEETLAGWHRGARQLAVVLGGVAAVAAGGAEAKWYYADTADEEFGQEVEDALLVNPATFQPRGAKAMVEVPDGDGDRTWKFIERVTRLDLPAWLNEKRNGPGRDPRILPLERDASGARIQLLRDAMAVMTPFKPKAPDDWPFRGPSASEELFRAIRGSGHDIGSYHDFYLTSSGLSPEHPVSHKHRDLLMVVHHLISYDQINGLQSAAAEAACRLVLQIHAAVARNAKAPDFRGTTVMVYSSLSTGGGTLVGDFAKWTAEEQKTEAFTMKQHRLYSEELGHASKAPPPGKGGAGK